MSISAVYSQDNLEAIMKDESPGKKCCLAISSGIHLCYAFIAGILLCVWWGNQSSIADVYNGNGNFYDQLPSYYYMNTALRAEYYRDADKASEYWADIEADCGTYDADDECWYEGNRFSTIFAFAGTTMMLLALNSCCMLAGTWHVQSRLLAGLCGCCCCCLNVACIITTGAFSFNSWGKLSALCNGPSKYDDDGLTLSDKATVASDTALILGLWACSIIYCCTNCCHFMIAGKQADG